MALENSLASTTGHGVAEAVSYYTVWTRSRWKFGSLDGSLRPPSECTVYQLPGAGSDKTAMSAATASPAMYRVQFCGIWCKGQSTKVHLTQETRQTTCPMHLKPNHSGSPARQQHQEKLAGHVATSTALGCWVPNPESDRIQGGAAALEQAP
jgi:hypothetical protein